MDSIILENEQLKQRVAELEAELELTKQHLKKYTAPSRNKKYYEENKDVILEKNKLYKKTVIVDKEIIAEKRKEINKRAYEKRKEKLKQSKENNNTTL
jgi:hypothetical protein